MRPAQSISVVVAVLNGAETLPRCLESILGQDHQSELIVMDGGSTDETLSIIRKYEGKICHWESNADGGIYDAWNRAIRIAAGEWICFLGADDYFSGATSLSIVAQGTSLPRVNFVSSKVALVDKAGRQMRVVGEPWNWNRMKNWHVIAHPGALHHRCLFKECGLFDTRYRIAGDYEFLLRAGHSIVPAFVDIVTVCMGVHGLSSTRVGNVLRETRAIQSGHREIGRKRAFSNFIMAYGKDLVRRAISWLR